LSLAGSSVVFLSACDLLKFVVVSSDPSTMSTDSKYASDDSEWDGPKENCGVVGIYGPELQVAQMLSLALIALQHRGQESCGIVTCQLVEDDVVSRSSTIYSVLPATFESSCSPSPAQCVTSHSVKVHSDSSIGNGVSNDNNTSHKQATRQRLPNFHCHKGIGLVSQVFNCEDALLPLQGGFGIGHTRYSTAGKKSSALDNTQPVIVQTYHGQIAIGHNGNLTTHNSLRNKLLKKGIGMFRDSDIEVIAQHLASNPQTDEQTDETQGPQWEKRLAAFMHECEGAYSLVVMTAEGIFACRDYLGMRPLSLGKITVKNNETNSTVDRYVVASESCALVMLGASYVREIEPGEIIKIDNNGITSTIGRQPKPALCIFEYVYFARPDSILEDQLIVSVREKLGMRLAREAPPPTGVDIVVGVPESAVPAAMGYAKQSAVQYVEGITKNRYVHRTFIQPTQTLRELGVSMKFTPVFDHLRGKKIVLVDDSIVRGSTIKNLVKMLRNAGAIEVHVRASAPPIRSPCFMGIDMATPDQMVAYNRTVEEVCKEIGADSLQYLSMEGLIETVKEGTNPTSKTVGGYCSACFTGNYPLKIDDW